MHDAARLPRHQRTRSSADGRDRSAGASAPGARADQHTRSGEPFPAESRYRAKLASGRILASDVDALLREQLGASGDDDVAGVASRFELWLAIVLHGIPAAAGRELSWILEETDSLSRFRTDVPAASRAALDPGLPGFTRRSSGFPGTLGFIGQELLVDGAVDLFPLRASRFCGSGPSGSPAKRYPDDDVAATGSLAFGRVSSGGEPSAFWRLEVGQRFAVRSPESARPVGDRGPGG